MLNNKRRWFRFSVRDLMWFLVVVGLLVAWRADHCRQAWHPTDDDLWIPFVESGDRPALAEMSGSLRVAEIPHAVRANGLGGWRILVTLPHLESAQRAVANHPALRGLGSQTSADEQKMAMSTASTEVEQVLQQFRLELPNKSDDEIISAAQLRVLRQAKDDSGMRWFFPAAFVGKYAEGCSAGDSTIGGVGLLRLREWRAGDSPARCKTGGSTSVA
ncbi:MAG: hypothetical protein ACYC0X_02085 [Pirellulaceae bacterium]